MEPIVRAEMSQQGIPPGRKFQEMRLPQNIKANRLKTEEPGNVVARNVMSAAVVGAMTASNKTVNDLSTETPPTFEWDNYMPEFRDSMMDIPVEPRNYVPLLAREYWF